MLPRMIYINGPKGSGKTALADLLCETAPGIIQVQFPMPLWEIADGILHQLGRQSETEPPLNFALPEVKASPIGEGLPTWREFLVEQANVFRKYFGPEVLGQIAATSSKVFFLQGIDTIIYPNVRTDDDLLPLVPLAPKREQVLIRLEREGTTWEGDNGSYLIPPPPIQSITLSNNGTPAELLLVALNFLEET